MAYEIIFMPEAREDLLALNAYDRKKILDAVEIHLRYEPEKVSKSQATYLSAAGPTGRGGSDAEGGYAIELNVQPDQVHLLVWIPPKAPVSEIMGFLKGEAGVVVV